MRKGIDSPPAVALRGTDNPMSSEEEELRWQVMSLCETPIKTQNINNWVLDDYRRMLEAFAVQKRIKPVQMH